MRIESITRLEKKQDKFAALFDDGVKIIVSAAQIADFGLYTGREISLEEFEELSEGIKLSTSKVRAVHILGNRNYSSREMQKRLERKGDAKETASQTVKWLEDTGLVSDSEYASAIVRHYYEKGYGLAKIKDELFRRGIGRDEWEEALNGLDGMEKTAYDFLMKKLRGERDEKTLRKATEMLCRRGFSYEQARTALSMYLESVEENEAEEP